MYLVVSNIRFLPSTNSSDLKLVGRYILGLIANFRGELLVSGSVNTLFRRYLENKLLLIPSTLPQKKPSQLPKKCYFPDVFQVAPFLSRFPVWLGRPWEAVKPGKMPWAYGWCCETGSRVWRTSGGQVFVLRGGVSFLGGWMVKKPAKWVQKLVYSPSYRFVRGPITPFTTSRGPLCSMLTRWHDLKNRNPPRGVLLKDTSYNFWQSPGRFFETQDRK